MIKDTTVTLAATFKSHCWTFIGIIAGLLAPIKWLMLLVGFMIVTDTVFGLWSSKKLGIKLESRKLSRFITKMLVYQLVVITVYMLDKIILGELLSLVTSIPMIATKIAALALVVAELFSIDEKLKNVNAGQGLWFHFSRLLRLAKTLKKEAKELTDDEDDK